MEICVQKVVPIEKVEEKNPKDRQGSTLLHIAANNGNLQLCQLIVNYINDNHPFDNLGM